MGETIILQIVIGEIVVQQIIVGEVIVLLSLRAAFGNTCLILSSWFPEAENRTKKWQMGPMSRRGTSFGTNFGRPILRSLSSEVI